METGAGQVKKEINNKSKRRSREVVEEHERKKRTNSNKNERMHTKGIHKRILHTKTTLIYIKII